MNQPARPRPPASTGDPALDARIDELLRASGDPPHPDLVRELVVTALKIGRDRPSVADLKLFNRTLKELRFASRILAPYAGRRKVAVFGSSRLRAGTPAAVAAETFGRRMAELGFMTITGGGEGIMGAAQKGAGREMSFGFNIRLPFEQRPNETIDGDSKLLNFHYFFTRKLSFLKEAHAIALFPGGFGTMDEGFEVITLMQTGKTKIVPVVMVDEPGGTFWASWLDLVRDRLLSAGLVSREDFSFFRRTDDVGEAIAEIARFYGTFHSYRWSGNEMLVRLNRPLPQSAIEGLNERFAPLLDGVPIVQRPALPEEADEPEIAGLPRLVFAPERREFGMFRELFDAINRAGETGEPRSGSGGEEPEPGPDVDPPRYAPRG